MANTLLMPFEDESHSFTNGFECGQIWQMISEGDNLTQYLIHSVNKKQIELICRSFGVDCNITESDSEWSYLDTFSIYTP